MTHAHTQLFSAYNIHVLCNPQTYPAKFTGTFLASCSNSYDKNKNVHTRANIVYSEKKILSDDRFDRGKDYT